MESFTCSVCHNSIPLIIPSTNEILTYSCGHLICPICLIDNFVFSSPEFWSSLSTKSIINELTFPCLKCIHGIAILTYDDYVNTCLNVYVEKKINPYINNKPIKGFHCFNGYDDFVSYVENKQNKFKKEFDSEYNAIMNIFSSLSKQIEDYKQIYTSYMENKLNDINTIFSLLKNNAKVYYNYNPNIHGIEINNKRKYEISKIDFNFNTQMQKEINSISNILFKIKKVINNNLISFTIRNTKFVLNPIYNFRNANNSSINTLLLINNNLMALTDDMSGDIQIWTLPMFELKQRFVGHETPVNCIVKLFGDNNKLLSYSNGDNSIRMWNVENGKCLSMLKYPHDKSEVYSMCVINKNIFVSAGRDKIIKIHYINDLNVINTQYELKGHNDTVYDIICFQRGRHICSCGDNGEIKIWDINNENHIKCIQDLQCDDDNKNIHNAVYRVCELESGFISAGYCNGFIRIWNWLKGKCTTQIKAHFLAVTVLLKVNNNTFLSGGDDGSVKMWRKENTDSFKWVNNKCFIGHIGPINAIILLDDEEIVTGSEDYIMKQWALRDFGMSIII